jgi:uncharacterized protein involved in type VI secretion and phage assembly
MMPVIISEFDIELSNDPRETAAVVAPADGAELAERARPVAGPTFPFYGVYPAVVSRVTDPDGLGRVKIRLPWAIDPDGSEYTAWARIATLMAGNSRGTWFIPDVGDEVLVAFEAGNPRRPYVVGALWNGVDAPPEQMDAAGNNNIRSIRSRNGILIQFEDEAGSEKLTLKTPGGQKIILEDGPGKISLTDSNGNVVVMETSGVTVTANTSVRVDASTVAVSAGMVTVDAGMSRFSGVVQCDTLISNSVVSASYTPGAGNIW